MQKPSLGRIVLYTLTDTDVALIDQQNPQTGSNRNRVRAGEQYPAMVVALFGEHANLKVLLDGGPGAEYWATSRPEGDTPGTWCWPPRV